VATRLGVSVFSGKKSKQCRVRDIGETEICYTSPSFMIPRQPTSRAYFGESCKGVIAET